MLSIFLGRVAVVGKRNEILNKFPFIEKPILLGHDKKQF
jgi:hypothetical protein